MSTSQIQIHVRSVHEGSIETGQMMIAGVTSAQQAKPLSAKPPQQLQTALVC